MRHCNKAIDYPEFGVNITEGTGIVVPLYHMHHDAAYFPEPEKFKPER